MVNIRGMTVNFLSLPTLYGNLFDKIHQLQKQLLFGLNLDIKTSDIVDDVSHKGLGYTMYSKTNGLIRHIYGTEALHCKYVQRVENERIVWNTAELEEYLRVYDEFVENLCLMIHFVSGMHTGLFNKMVAIYCNRNLV